MKKFKIILAILVIIASAIFVASKIFVTQDGVGSPVNDVETSAVVTPDAVAPKIQTAPTTEWKTYTDTKDGFQFIYPAQATVKYDRGIGIVGGNNYGFWVSTSTQAGYVSSPTLHTQYRYTYDAAKN